MRGFTGTKANTENGFVTLMNLTSLSAEVKAWSEAFPVIVLLIGPLPFWTLSSNKFSHRYFPCKYTFKKPNLSEGVWRKIPHLSQSCLLSPRMPELSPTWNIYFSIKFHWNPPTGWKVSGTCTSMHMAELHRAHSQGNQANNANLVSSSSTQIANLTALKTEAPFPLGAMYYSKVSSQNWL